MKIMVKNIIKDKSGQSLMEILVALTIATILIGAASIALLFIINSGKTIKDINIVNKLTQDLLNRAQTFALMDWWNFSNLSSTSTFYFFVATSSKVLPVFGKEVILNREVKNGLVGHWGFDEETGTIAYDYTGLGNYGVLSSGALRAENCHFYRCVLLDGASGSNVNLGNKDVYNTNSFSISLWVKPVSLKTNISGPNGNIFLGKEVYLTSGFRMGISGTPPIGQVSFWTTQSGGTLSLNSGSYLLSTSSFYHIVVTYSQGENIGKMYINGSLVGSGVGSYYPALSANLFIDGGVGGVDFLNGYFDDVRWYNRALTEEEVKNLFTSKHYRRYFFVRDVCRSSSYNNSSSLLDALPCSPGYFNDSFTKKIISYVEWEGEDNKIANYSLFNYVTNWRNSVFDQTDWSGGVNPNAIYSFPSNQYASGSNITTTPFGSFSIENVLH
jgi:hypothetical protein